MVDASLAVVHLKRHSEFSGYFPSGWSGAEISRALLADPPDAEHLNEVASRVAAYAANEDRQRECLADAEAYLPPEARPREPVYVTWGYDIGVATPGSASLNAAHSHFAEAPDEFWFYCTHEGHHDGLMTLYPFPQLSSLATVGELAKLVRYATFLEGLAVHAARTPRARYDALQDDPDYVALLDDERMAEYERHYWAALAALEARANEPITDADWESLDIFSDTERLWYRVGALMAARIEEAWGREALIEVIGGGPDAFFEAYQTLSSASSG